MKKILFTKIKHSLKVFGYFFFTFLSLSIMQSYALTFITTTYCCGMSGEIAHTSIATMSTNKASYQAGETITITTSVDTYTDAGYQVGYGIYSAQSPVADPYIGYINTGNLVGVGGFSNSADSTYVIPGGTTPGNYTLPVRSSLNSYDALDIVYASRSENTTLSYSVVIPVTVNVNF